MNFISILGNCLGHFLTSGLLEKKTRLFYVGLFGLRKHSFSLKYMKCMGGKKEREREGEIGTERGELEKIIFLLGWPLLMVTD